MTRRGTAPPPGLGRRAAAPDQRHPARSFLAGKHRGVDEVLAFLGRVAELSNGTFTVDLQAVASGNGHTFALHTGRGRWGQVLEDHNVLVCHLRSEVDLARSFRGPGHPR